MNSAPTADRDTRVRDMSVQEAEKPVINIILIEDNNDDAYLIENVLTDRFRLLHRFNNGEEALSALEAGRFSPDVILVDYQLPSMDGVEIIRTLTAPDDQVRSFIMLTADTRIETAIEAMKAGARDFHPKTWGFDALPEAIERVYRIHKDLVERREFQIALRRSERLLSFAIDQMPVPIVVADAESGEIRHINEPARTLASMQTPDEDLISIEDFANRTLCRVVPNSLPEQSLNPLVSAWRDGVETKGVELYVGRNGKDHWVSASAAPLYDECGNAIAVIGAFPDITAQKMASVQLEELNASKDRFFSIIGHDLRNPACQISLAIQLLLNQPDTCLPEKVKLNLNRAQRSTDNLIRLLESLLQWGRLQTNNMEFVPQKIPLLDCLEDNVADFKITAEQKSIELQIDCPEKLYAFADMHMFNAIVRNLISNAIKFTPQRGRIDLISKPDSGMVSIAVKDTGVGIPKDCISTLFDVSEDKIQTGTDGEKGTGLGLMLCKDMVRKNKGHIDVESTPGKGTTITVRFPLWNPDGVVPQSTPPGSL